MTKAEKKAFGERVHEWRMREDMTVRDACTALRIAPGTLLRIEDGYGCLERIHYRIKKFLDSITVAS